MGLNYTIWQHKEINRHNSTVRWVLGASSECVSACTCVCVCLLGDRPAPCASVILATEHRLCCCGMGCTLGSECVGRCLKGRRCHPPNHWGYRVHRRRRRRECFPPFTHTHSYLRPSLLVHSHRKAFELKFIELLCAFSSFIISPRAIKIPFFPPPVFCSYTNAPNKFFRRLSSCRHLFSAVICVCSWPRRHSDATSLTGFVCKELSAGGRWRALSWLPSTNEPLLTWSHCSVWLKYCPSTPQCVVTVDICVAGGWGGGSQGDERRSELIWGLDKVLTVTAGWEPGLTPAGSRYSHRNVFFFSMFPPTWVLPVNPRPEQTVWIGSN